MGEGRRKSWREIDQMRDGTFRGGRRRPDARSELERALDNPRMKELYLKEAEKLFQGAKGGQQHPKDIRAIHDAFGTPKFGAAVKHYLDTYGFPEDWGTLLLLLDLKKDPGVVSEAIDRLCAMVAEKGPVERKGLKSKLKVLSLTARDPEVREAAETRLDDVP